MKKISSYITALAIGALALQSCSDNWEQPAYAVPTFPSGLEANTTIADLKAAYWQDSDSYGTRVGLLDNGDSIVIVGTIMSTTTPATSTRPSTSRTRPAQYASASTPPPCLSPIQWA